MPSIFSKIILGEIPSYKITENEYCIAFLDIAPLSIGHTLIVPKKEIDYFFDLPNEDYIQLSLFAKQVAVAIKKSVSCERIASVVLGFEVPHAHIHLIPAKDESTINFSNLRIKLSKEEMALLAENIAKNFVII